MELQFAKAHIHPSSDVRN